MVNTKIMNNNNIKISLYAFPLFVGKENYKYDTNEHNKATNTQFHEQLTYTYASPEDYHHQ